MRAARMSASIGGALFICPTIQDRERKGTGAEWGSREEKYDARQIIQSWVRTTIDRGQDQDPEDENLEAMVKLSLKPSLLLCQKSGTERKKVPRGWEERQQDAESCGMAGREQIREGREKRAIVKAVRGKVGDTAGRERERGGNSEGGRKDGRRGEMAREDTIASHITTRRGWECVGSTLHDEGAGRKKQWRVRGEVTVVRTREIAADCWEIATDCWEDGRGTDGEGQGGLGGDRRGVAGDSGEDCPTLAE
ncbi:hypothetical protein EDB83DRAFT_2553565 [Lactarius deliciosus]|nr:hypothetical protein EDB83DRAFT_2553565 [Lactarius deliciosus]